MPIRFACPNCHTDYTTHDRAAGTEFGCAGCGHRMLVPAALAGPPAAPVVVYMPPADVADYRPPRQEVPRVERVYIREDVHYVHQERGTFASSFGRTMGNGCGCLLVMAIAGAVVVSAFVALAVLTHPPQ